MDAEERKRYENQIEEMKRDLKIANEAAADYERFWKRLKAERAMHSQESRETLAKAAIKLQESPMVQLGPIDIDVKERIVDICYSEEPREFATTNPAGRIMYVLLKDFDDKQATEGEIGDAMRERGWNYGHSTTAPELSKLKRNGDIISDNGRPAHYRIPGKLKIHIEDK